MSTNKLQKQVKNAHTKQQMYECHKLANFWNNPWKWWFLKCLSGVWFKKKSTPLGVDTKQNQNKLQV